MHAVVLKYFREVARQGSVRRAATTLNVAASAVNRQILKLETELGTPVFDRLPGRMRLTMAGEILLHHVDHTLGEFDRVRGEIDDLRAVKTGHVSILAVDSLLVDFLPRAIEAFRADFPAVTYSVLAAAPADIPGEVASGRADLGFTFLSRLPKGVRFMTSIAAPIGVVMPARHPLARHRQIRYRDARAYPILTPFGPLPKGADVDPSLNAFKNSVQPRLVSNSIQMLRQAIRQNMGISFFSRLGFLRDIADGELVWRPLASRLINTLRLGLIVPTGRPLLPVAAALADRLTQALQALEKSA